MSLYEYRATIVGVHDGDTITVDVDLGWKTWRREEPIRLGGLDAPELNTAAGKEARDYLQAILFPGDVITLRTEKDREEKYGRMLGWVTTASGLVINDGLLKTGHARPWNGKGPRP